MAEAAKTIVVYGLLGKSESAYGGGGTVTTTDGIQLAGLPTLEKSYIFDGERPAPPGTYGILRRAAPGGRIFTSTFSIEGKGAGATYSGSVTPPNVHTMLKASGLTATQGGTTWSYAPTPGPSGFGSMFGEAYSRGEKWPITGVYADLSIVADSPAPPRFEFAVSGILGTRVDAAVPSITYPALTVVPPLAQNLTLTIAGVSTLVVRSFTFKMNADKDNQRTNLNGTTNPFAGFVRGRRAPTLEVTVENPAQATWDYIAAEDAGTNVAASLVVGSVAFNRYTLSLPQCTVLAQPNDDDPVSLLDLTLHAYNTSPLANDDMSLVFD